ncbi:uncharacterized protein LOC117124403 [Anneissia japonica]|uniref:uncharacterized protein LOC117124403 n=1 Tax=Anneissia japonica TaxID=1529436 RepID=UPI0014257E46|nr:uncharacterized protein LOC117124403 [Anneissia japonica]
MEIERLEKEKAVVISDLTSKMDAGHHQLTSAAKDRDSMLEAHMSELKRIEDSHQEEKKILEDQLTSEKDEKLRLQQMLDSRPRETLAESENTGAGNASSFAVLAATSGISQEEKEKLEEEKIRLEAERNRFQQEKEQYQEKMLQSQKVTDWFSSRTPSLGHPYYGDTLSGTK